MTRKSRATTSQARPRRQQAAGRKPQPAESGSALHELFLEEIKDLYNAEQQLTKALPKMARAAKSPDLKRAFEEHLGQTKGHVERLNRIAGLLGTRAQGKRCKGMEGLVAEGAELIEEDMDASAKDAGLIGAAQRVEHYEIAGYGTLRTFARRLGEDTAAELLEQTLTEEKDADSKLTDLAEQVNDEAAEEEDAEADEVADESVVPNLRSRGSRRG